MGKERVEQLKASSKEMLESIGADTPLEQKAIRMIYGFVLSLYEECMAGKGGAV